MKKLSKEDLFNAAQFVLLESISILTEIHQYLAEGDAVSAREVFDDLFDNVETVEKIIDQSISDIDFSQEEFEEGLNLRDGDEEEEHPEEEISESEIE